MLVEFAGLPAAGKSTVMEALAEELRGRGVAAERLTDVARARMRDNKKRYQFVRKRVERASLYGSVCYGHKNPEIYAGLSQFRRDHPKETYSNLEFLAELFFAADEVAGPDVLLADEGFVHRGITAFNGRDDLPGLERYINALPLDLICIKIDVRVRVAARRSRENRGQMPYVRNFRRRDPVEVLRETWHLLQHASTLCTARGIRMISINGRQPVADSVDQVLEVLLPLCQPQPARTGSASQAG
ncbi:MAG: hypothetical protein AAGP08_03510 [Pseudomonadota bacterium]